MNAMNNTGWIIIRTADLDVAADREAVDAFVLSQPEGTPFHRPAWSRAVARATGNRSHYLVAEQKGVVTGVLPLTHMKSPLFGSALVSAGFAVDGGVLSPCPHAKAQLVDEAQELAGKLGSPAIELRGGPLPPFWRQSEGTYAGFVRDLPEGGEDAVLKAIPRKQRAEVRKALDLGMEASFGADLKSHYAVYAESVRNLGTPVFSRKLFVEMLAQFGGDADILVISKDGRAVASVFSFYQNGTVYPYWGGGTFEARGLRANELLYFALMNHAVARGCTRFDFGRSKVGTGAYSYKKNWGFEPQPLVYASWGEARETNPMSAKYKMKVEAWKKLPLWAANMVGPFLSRGLG